MSPICSSRAFDDAARPSSTRLTATATSSAVRGLGQAEASTTTDAAAARPFCCGAPNLEAQVESRIGSIILLVMIISGTPRQAVMPSSCTIVDVDAA